MSAESTRTLARSFFLEQDRMRGGPAPALCAPAYTAHLAGNPPFDLAGHQAFAAAFYAGFPDLRHEVEQVLVEGERAALRFTLYGTHGGPFAGLEPTGRPVAVTATAVMRLEAGRIAELWAEFDQVGLMRQLTAPVLAAVADGAGGI